MEDSQYGFQMLNKHLELRRKDLRILNYDKYKKKYSANLRNHQVFIAFCVVLLVTILHVFQIDFF